MRSRDEILAVIQVLIADRPDREFHVREVVRIMRANGSRFGPSTILGSLASSMCVGSPAKPGRKFRDVQRLGSGRSRLIREGR